MRDIRYIVNLLLSLLILTVASYPCADKYSVLTHASSPLTTSYNVDNSPVDSQKEQQADYCSPMCSCNCCASFITLANKIGIAQVQQINSSKKHLSNYKDLVQNVHPNIWQPPKIS